MTQSGKSNDSTIAEYFTSLIIYDNKESEYQKAEILILIPNV